MHEGIRSAWRGSGSFVPPCFRGLARRDARRAVWAGLTLLGLAVGNAFGDAVDPATIESDDVAGRVDHFYREKIQRAGREQQELYRVRVSIPDAVGQNVPNAAAARLAARREGPVAVPPVSIPISWLERNQPALLFVGAALLTLGLGVRKLTPGLFKALNTQFNPWVAGPVAENEPVAKVRAEEVGLADFLAAFRAGPAAASADAAPEPPGVRAEALRVFYAKSVKTLETQRQMLQEIERTSDEGGRLKLLLALRWEMHALRNEAGLRELLPVWQTAFACEGLLKQLTDNIANVMPSTLRTLAGGVELIGDLSRPGIEPDLLTRQPLRLLAVDDDPISRKAVSLALKRALNEPELAEDGEAALELAAHNTFDVVFLDVQMPGMDGFEVCTKIHEIPGNRHTPIVFVTCQSDFDSRAKSALSGGSDLIGKPFLTFEITVKALTLALRGRLQAREQAALAEEPAAAPRSAPDATTDSAEASQTFATATDREDEAERIAEVFMARASAQLAPLREAFHAIFQAKDEAARQFHLADVFLRVHSFTPKQDLPAMHPALQLSATLEGLLRKLLEQPQSVSASTFFTLATGVDLLDELCTIGAQPTLLSQPPVRLLVVDDDPVSRRALTIALQMTFEKPESAESGDQALELAARRHFDVIFLDVQMPGMDGFEVCTRIRKSTANSTTPVVFVTGHNDSKTRNQITHSGGSDFVAKPFLTGEIMLKALIFALRGRLDQLRVASPVIAAMPAGCS